MLRMSPRSVRSDHRQSSESEVCPHRRKDPQLLQPMKPPLPTPISVAERDAEAGQMLLELERRQDDVLSQLDDLDQKLSSILRGLGVTIAADEEATNGMIRLAELDDAEELDTDQPPFGVQHPRTERRKAA